MTGTVKRLTFDILDELCFTVPKTVDWALKNNYLWSIHIVPSLNRNLKLIKIAFWSEFSYINKMKTNLRFSSRWDFPKT